MLTKKISSFLIFLCLLFSSSVQAKNFIIGFVGKKGVGKDTAADYLVEHYNFKKYAMAEPMKESLMVLFKFNQAQLYGDKKEIIDSRWNVSPREMMKFIGVDTLIVNMSNRYPQLADFYLKHFDLKLTEYPEHNFTVCDLRFQRDVDHIKSKGGIIVKINRNSLVVTDQHISETGVDDIIGIDFYLDNNGSLQDYITKVAILSDRIIADAS